VHLDIARGREKTKLKRECKRMIFFPTLLEWKKEKLMCLTKIKQLNPIETPS